MTDTSDTRPAEGEAQAARQSRLHRLMRLLPLNAPVLLVDDLVDSGWTMSLAGRALRRAGAEGVLPLALAVSA